MATQNKIFIGFESNISEWFPNPEDFTKQVEKNPGLYLIIVIKSENKEEFQNKYNAFINQIYDKRAVQYATEYDNFKDTIEDLKHELDSKNLCNQNTQIIIANNSAFYNEIKDSGINCKSITEEKCITSSQAKKTQMSSGDIFTVAINQRNALEMARNAAKLKKQAKTEEIKEEIKEEVKEVPDNKEEIKVEVAKDTKESNVDLARQRATQLGKVPESPPKTPESITIVELEKSIFNSVLDEELNLSYSKVDDAKAELVNQLSVRLIEHINALYPEIANAKLNYQDYTKIFEMFNKALDSRTFLQLWFDKFPSIIVKSNQDSFERIKGEAIYYYKICNFLYCEDNFDVFKI